MTPGGSDHLACKPPRLALRPVEVAEALGISRSALYLELSSGRLESITIGRSRRITYEQLTRYLDRLSADAGATAFGSPDDPNVE
jgi:excisionase family DNA binding protein